MLCNAAQAHGWTVDILYVPPGDDALGLLSHIRTYKPDLVGFSIKSFERKQAFEIAAAVRNASSVKTIAGGVHPTLMPEEAVQSGLFDGVIVGDGMGVIARTLDDYQQLDGTVITGEPHPDKELYCRFFYSQSQKKRMRGTETASLLSTHGCPYHCKFCHAGRDKYQVFPIEHVARSALNLYKDYGVRSFHFLDDLFATNVKRLRQFRRIVEETFPELSFSSQVSGRANSFTREIADELVLLGVETVNFGIETASTRLLELLNKKQTVEDCYRAMEVCRDTGLNCVVNLMFGFPIECEQDYMDTLEFVQKTQPDHIHPFFFTPYPGTELYDYCFDNHLFPESYDRNRFDWFEPQGKGISGIQARLKGVDYDLALQYVERIKDAVNRDKALFERMEIIDRTPWVLVGTSRHYYFGLLLKTLSGREWRNCLGYINMDEEAGFVLEDSEIRIPMYNRREDNVPLCCATYSFIGSDYATVQRYLEMQFEEGMPLISISSFRRSHSAAEIRSILNESFDSAQRRSDVSDRNE